MSQRIDSGRPREKESDYTRLAGKLCNCLVDIIFHAVEFARVVKDESKEKRRGQSERQFLIGAELDFCEQRTECHSRYQRQPGRNVAEWKSILREGHCRRDEYDRRRRQ